MDELQAMAIDLLAILHRSMDWNVWGEKRLKYWDIFQENAAAASYTNSLAKWIARFCSRMSVPAPGRNTDDRARLDAILNSGQDRALLKKLREETQLLVLSVRVAQQEKKEAYAASQAEQAWMELAAIDSQSGTLKSEEVSE